MFEAESSTEVAKGMCESTWRRKKRERPRTFSAAVVGTKPGEITSQRSPRAAARRRRSGP